MTLCQLHFWLVIHVYKFFNKRKIYLREWSCYRRWICRMIIIEDKSVEDVGTWRYVRRPDNYITIQVQGRSIDWSESWQTKWKKCSSSLNYCSYHHELTSQATFVVKYVFLKAGYKQWCFRKCSCWPSFSSRIFTTDSIQFFNAKMQNPLQVENRHTVLPMLEGKLSIN